MNTLLLALQSSWKVLLYSLILGAGLPAIFALGVRSYAAGTGELTTSTHRSPVGKLVAALCFAIVAVGVLAGLTLIIASGFGKSVSFAHVIPEFVSKK